MLITEKPGNFRYPAFESYAAGRLINTPADGQYPEGTHSVVWSGMDSSGSRRLPSGLYFCRLFAEEFTETRSMILLK
ncbi:MAG: hypothetical protein K8S62_05640 [Candidatus Sabulitectum sp.]|nr:hypothetical protein [Candidatus Sabulitectum sp.]